MRRAILTFCLCAIIAVPCQAQGDKRKPNTLTPKEIADGWILLFDGETTFGWRSGGYGKGSQFKVDDGCLDFSKLAFARCTTAFQSCEMAFECRCTAQNGHGSFTVWESPNDRGSGVSASFPVPQKIWTSVQIRVENKTIDSVIAGNKGSRDWRDGGTPCLQVGQTFGKNGDGSIQVRNIKLRPLNTKSLFNGKDLAGWTVFPKRKSQFAVVDGAINVKDGPGDLQTTGKYQDFVLQLDCISNGKHLNSGIFFRCRENEYQNGYEAQIHNGFTDTPKKYPIEEYDPKTNKLIGKKEMSFNAVDFGTGAIYRRMPARKQMSKDNEWFAMTIAAHGNHFATWVNGVQVTDWYDHRPPSDNARTGYRKEGGHISIQGHDPTTNLSFKNFRISELK